MITVVALLFGLIAGLRTMVPLAAMSVAAVSGRLALEGTWLAFLGAAVTPFVTLLLVAAEFVADQLPSTPSRKVPLQFGARIAVGALCGAALGLAGGGIVPCVLAGTGGAILGTVGGAEMRARLAHVFGRDRPAALIEDAIAVGAAIVLVLAL